MIKVPNFDHFRNGEFVKFTHLCTQILSTQNTENLKIKAEAAALTSTQNQMRDLYTIDRGSSLTTQIVAQDDLRDNMHSAIIALLDTHEKYNPDESIRASATALIEVFTKHGRQINRQSYHSQTINLEDIFSDLDNKQSKERMASCKIDAYYNTLTQANKTFDTLYLQRNKEYARAPKEKLATLRTQAEEEMLALFARINAFITISGIGNYQSLVNELNALTENFEKSIKIRRGNGSSNSNDEVLNEDLELVQE